METFTISTDDWIEYRNNATKYLEQHDQYATRKAVQIAIDKQIPMKITHPGCYDNEGLWHTWNGINGVPYDLCPNCEINLCTDGAFDRDKKRMNYCENCGQKLDWS